MFSRYVKITLLSLATILLFSLIFAPKSSAIFENYRWQDYKTVVGTGGIYGVINSSQQGADSAQNIFTMTDESNNIFTLGDAPQSCPSSLKITVINYNNGHLSSDGNCAPLAGADKNIHIDGKQVAIQSVGTKAGSLALNYQNQASCSKLHDANDQADCAKKASDTVDAAKQKCLSSHDYNVDILEAQPYIDCLKETLLVNDKSDQQDDVEDSDTDDQDKKCEIKDAGWIVCQAISVVSHITDYTFTLLKPFLILNPLTETTKSGDDSSTYKAWVALRDISNVVLVMGLIIILYSQITGFGVSAYGIKKLLPRLIVTAILINVSFFICALAVDASNIAGVSLQKTFKTIASKSSNNKDLEFGVVTSDSDEYKDWSSVTRKVISTPPIESSDQDSQDQNGNGQNGQNNQNQDEEGDSEFTKLVVGGVTITGIGVMLIELIALIPIMVMALFAMITVLIVLLLRKTIVIILIIISPLALACFLLPNTVSWFNKWRRLFLDMLVLFPAISIVFGASFFASSVIRETAEKNGQVLLAIFSMGIMVIPLFVSPLLIKLGGRTVSSAVNLVNNKLSGIRGSAVNRANDFRDDRRTIRKMNATQGKPIFGKIPVPKRVNRYRWTNINSRYNRSKQAAEQAASSQQAKLGAENASDITEKATKHINDDASKAIQGALTGIATDKLEKVELEQVDAAWAKFKNDTSITQDEVRDMALGAIGRDGKELTEAEQRAAIRLYGEQFMDPAEVDVNGNVRDGASKARELMAGSGSRKVNIRREIVQTLRKSGVSKTSPDLGGSSLGKVEHGDINSMEDVNNLLISAAEKGKFSQQALAGAAYSTQVALNVNIENGAISQGTTSRLKTNAANSLENPNLRTTMTKRGVGELERMKR